MFAVPSLRPAVRLAPAWALLAVVFGLGFAAHHQAPPRPLGAPVSDMGPGGAEEDAALAGLPGTGRTAYAEVEFVSGPQGIRERATYTIRTRRGDPLLRLIRLGEVRSGPVARRYAGAPGGASFRPAVIETRGGDGDVLITITSSYLGISPEWWVTVREAGVASGLTVRTRGIDLSRVSAPMEPTAQNATTVVFDAAAGQGKVRVALAAKGSSSPDPSGSLNSLGNNPALWHVARAMPWIVLLVAASLSRDAGCRRFRVAGWAYLGAVPPLAALLLYASEQMAGSVLSLVFVVAPALAVGWLRTIGDPPRPASPTYGPAMLAVAAGVSALAVLAFGGAPWQRFAWLVGLTVAAGAFGLLSAVCAGWPRRAVPLALAFVPGTVVTEFLAGQLWRSGNGLAYLAFGVLLAPLAVGVVDLARPVWPWLWRAGAVVVVVSLAVPVGMLAEPAITMNAPTPQYLVTVGEMAVSVLDVAMLGVLVIMLARRGDRAATLAEPLARGAVIAVAVIVAAPGYQTAFGPAVATVLLVLVLLWALPPSRAQRAVDLAEVSGRTHERLLRREIWHRFRQRLAHAVYRAGPDGVVSGDRELSDLRTVWAQVNDAGTRWRGIALTERALGSSAGFRPRDNALAGAVAAGALTAPMALYEVWISYVGTDYDHSASLTALVARYGLNAARWLVYGAVFGYFYTRLRGMRPISKACGLVAAIAIPELLAIATVPYSTQQAILFATGIRAGQLLVLAIGLGLYWEWRLAQAAGVPWGRIRDFRTPTALAAPITAVAVALTTAVATPLAGAAVATLLQPSPAPPSSTVQSR
ncbi:hypothetical protein [Thermomonospora umbrina]|uniref:Uncharacterized protein n=1 Tax=Thermomonospora umbrina TaxID=111806 RepID=A0A3D9SR12_9ACTN|nr:hypothetical protein [Thermomonospora umbrina]REE95074.1 hypothetical protein DFJ69_0454 [Thermomonospora umbrina]